MDPRRPSPTLMSFAVSAMLTSALLATAPGGAYTAAATGPQPRALINAFEGLRAAAWSGTQSVSLPTPPAAIPTAAIESSAAPASASPALDPLKLSPAEMRTQLQILAQHGNHVSITPTVTQALGLTAGSQTLWVDEVSYGFPLTPSENGFTHSFATLPDGGYLFFRVKTNSNNISLFGKFLRLDRNQNLIAAYSWVQGGSTTRLSWSEAEAQLRDEIHAWRAAQAGQDKL